MSVHKLTLWHGNFLRANLPEIANTVEVIHDGRIHIEKFNGPFLLKEGCSLGGILAGLELAINGGGSGSWFGNVCKIHAGTLTCSPCVEHISR